MLLILGRLQKCVCIEHFKFAMPNASTFCKRFRIRGIGSDLTFRTFQNLSIHFKTMKSEKLLVLEGFAGLNGMKSSSNDIGLVVGDLQIHGPACLPRLPLEERQSSTARPPRCGDRSR